jgi:RNA polymerase sigma-70 factor (ECF subfamily)
LREFDSIYHEFRPKIHRYLSNLTCDNDAPDLTQTVFLKISRSLDNFREESSLSTWIYRIATNTAHDHAVSSLAKQNAFELLFDDADLIDDLPDTGFQGSDLEYIRREMNSCIREIIDKLPQDFRTVLILSDFEELKDHEISEILGLSLNTVKIRLHRARAKLREALECLCTFYHDERSELACDRKGDE